MPLAYAVKHVLRSWKLFLALLIGIVLASTFFAGIDIKANLTAKQALDQRLSNIQADMDFAAYNLNSTQLYSVQQAVDDIGGVSSVEWVSRLNDWPITIQNSSSTFNKTGTVVAILDNSRIYDGWSNGPSDGIGENETYVYASSALASAVQIGSIIEVNFDVYVPPNHTRTSLKLTVKGFAELDSKAYTLALAQRSYYFPGYVDVVGNSNLLLINWEKTLKRLVDSRILASPEVTYYVYLDRDSVIKAWDIQTSVNTVRVIRNSIWERLNTDLNVNVEVHNNLEEALQSFSFNSTWIRLTFAVISLPIFFIAWYMGTTVSDVSFNLRRREIGLLMTKGFSRGQILRIFWVETLLVGFAGGILGVLLSVALVPLFTQFKTGILSSLSLLDPYTSGSTIVFAVVIAFLSTYRSARHSSQLPTVEALKEHLSTEASKPQKRRWHWLAFILGSYKIAIFVAGVNVPNFVYRSGYFGGNFMMSVLSIIWIIVDGVLTFIGPVLFVWGLSKLLIQGSMKFQELTTRAARFLGELGALATKNVRRNPTRSAAMAFLIALIVSYSIQVSGQLASQNDFSYRTAYFSAGADISIDVQPTDNPTRILEAINLNLSDSIQNSTIEYSFYMLSGSSYMVNIKAVQPQSWLASAYYEEDWFSGTDIKTAFEELSTDNNTIVLRKAIAQLSNLKIGDNISLTDQSGTGTMKLRIVGFFGPELQGASIVGGFSEFWSFTPETLYDRSNAYAREYARILIKLRSGSDGKAVAESIRNLGLDLGSVHSFAENWEAAHSDIIQAGTLEVLNLGVFFSALAASVGITLVSVVSMKERGHEAAIMSVRGLSYKQLIVMFFTENVAIVIFSVLVGLFVGVVAWYGNISATNSQLSGALIMQRLVLPMNTLLTISFCVALIVISSLLPILVMSRRYATKLGRMVRLR